MKIGIAGFGVVGQAVFCYFKTYIPSCDIIIYDPPKQLGAIEQLKVCDYIFACLPTPNYTDKKLLSKQDFGPFSNLLAELKDFDGILVIKSTCTHENIDFYIPRFKMVMSPEFLCANTAFDDILEQTVIVLGGQIDYCLKVQNLYRETGLDLQFKFMSIHEAIDVKYVHNIYHAYKVLFWNYVQDITGNQRKIFDTYASIVDTDASKEKATVCADGLPGFGGECFLKDLEAFKTDHPHMLTDFMQAYNAKLRYQNITK